MEARRPQLAEIGLFLLVVALPLVFTPFSASPFGDGKLVVLVAGCLALAASGLAADRRISIVGGALVAATLLAALFGVDPLEGLTARTTSSGGGLITVVCAVVLAALGASMPTGLRDRATRWSIGAGVAVAAIGLATRLVPAVFEELFPGSGLSGSTLGNPVFAIAFVAAALGALLATEPPPERRWFWVSLVVMTLGLAAFGERASIVFAIGAGAIALWRLPSSRRRVARALAVIVALLVVWQVVDPLLPLPGSLRPQLATLSSERARFAMWEVGLRSAAERPALGWGPGSTRSAHIANATASDLETSGRGVADAHNLFVNGLV
ncbi:MAG: O-antigen ligase family protein, partial [Actinomycetota bacterium]